MTFLRKSLGQLLILVTIVASGVGLAYQHVSAQRFARMTLAEREAYWSAQIGQHGAAIAYQSFKTSVANVPPDVQHVRAHVFGAALFDTAGVDGFSVCDATFNYGCYHEFLGRAIASLGLDVVNTLNDTCITVMQKNALACQHGIGHGIEAYLGYTFDALKKTLATCQRLPHNDPIGGCFGGAFMEFNLQTMLGDAGTVRPLTVQGEHYPCDQLSATFDQSCYFWQPQWWHWMLRNQNLSDEDTIYRMMGSYCASAPSQYRRSCFEGIGNDMPFHANFDGNRARELCIDATSDPTDQLYCRSLAANALFVGAAGKTGDAAAVCSGLSKGSHSYCIAYATNQANIAFPENP